MSVNKGHSPFQIDLHKHVNNLCPNYISIYFKIIKYWMSKFFAAPKLTTLHFTWAYFQEILGG